MKGVEAREGVPNVMKVPRPGAFGREVITWGPGEDLSVEAEVISQSSDEAEKNEKP